MFEKLQNSRYGYLLSAEIILMLLLLFGALPAFAGSGGGEKAWYEGFTPIVFLLAAVAVVFWRLPKPKEDKPGELKHLEDKAYTKRRFINYMFLGMTYAFLYWGRYNLNPAIIELGGKEMVANFNWVFGAGTAAYGVSFLINGPLTDRLGGRFSILMGAGGATVMNLLMGIAVMLNMQEHITSSQLMTALLILYPINMYFQSFGAVAIVKCNAPWFHVNERGVFGAIFGILISLGIYFAFDWSYAIAGSSVLGPHWAFFAPSIALAIAFVFDIFIVRNTPKDAGLYNIKTKDATSGEDQDKAPDGAIKVFKMMLSNKVILMIAAIEFCSGFLRQAIMQMYRPFCKSVEMTAGFVYDNWGMSLCIAGIMGGVFAGLISDHVFGSRRGPVAGVLYAGMLAGSVAMLFLLDSPYLGYLTIFMSLCVIGVHGMLSGTASMDFGGTKNVGIAVGIIDGFVYAGTALQAVLYANILPSGGELAKDPANWINWPVAMIPFAAIGLFFAWKIRNEKPGNNEEQDDLPTEEVA
jgi:OPA family glycerol-3-phosphate transporter-like MFS transporter